MKTDEEIARLVLAFEACTLPAEQWTHTAHLIVALWYLRQHPRAEATALIRAGITCYNRAQGSKGYHETMTLAWIAVVARFLADHDRCGQSLADLAVALGQECGDRHHLLRFYSRDVLHSPESHRAWVPPDLRPIE
jgi:hypothetical protein